MALPCRSLRPENSLGFLIARQTTWTRGASLRSRQETPIRPCDWRGSLRRAQKTRSQVKRVCGEVKPCQILTGSQATIKAPPPKGPSPRPVFEESTSLPGEGGGKEGHFCHSASGGQRYFKLRRCFINAGLPTPSALDPCWIVFLTSTGCVPKLTSQALASRSRNQNSPPPPKFPCPSVH